ncbi:hypothetical protein V2J09_017920 [Rumex salicifolius]
MAFWCDLACWGWTEMYFSWSGMDPSEAKEEEDPSEAKEDDPEDNIRMDEEDPSEQMIWRLSAMSQRKRTW